MPTVLRIGPYRVFFFSADGGEPMHVHIEREDRIAKFWLDPVRLVVSGGLNRSELRDIEQIVRDNRDQLMRAWNDYFSD